MAKPKKKQAKRGRKEERLIITGDPQAALRELLKPKPKKKPKR
ncbi:MAG TPA: hypothetical protein VGJ69_09530 [Pyrinomonadaceae bacterium]